MIEMKYRRFGRTEIQMPVFSCGSMRFQESWEDIPPDRITEKSQKNLEATVKMAFELGINHFETARGYGTSEVQLGKALKILPREKIIVQTKVGPSGEPSEFAANLAKSFENLKLDYIDLLSLHGVNNEKSLEMMKPCIDILNQWKSHGRIKHIGFSTHGSCKIIMNALKTGDFEYLNLHYYYIFQDNLDAIKLADELDLGVFIISPSDKGGKLYEPTEKLKKLTAPLTPMQFNDFFCLSTPGIHSISIGAARPEDFNEHMEILPELDKLSSIDKTVETADRLDRELISVLGSEWIESCREKLPDWHKTPGEINLPVILRLYNLMKTFDMIAYGKMRYNILGDGGHWFPGNKAYEAAKFAEKITELCRETGNAFADKIPAILTETHEALNEEKVKNLADADLKPASLWRFFAEICAIPHPSGLEGKLAEYILKFCEVRSIPAWQDETGNIFIEHGGMKREGDKRILFQAHLDMVPQADNARNHDFAKDPIVPLVDDGWVRADATTLGADNGIAVAALLALMDDESLKDIPFNILLTVEEETGLRGAQSVSPDFFDGDMLINLDAEDIGEIYIACAGACSTTGRLELEYTEADTTARSCFILNIFGLEGGHSGVDIILRRANAILILGEILAELAEKFDLTLAEIYGGSLMNAIPREASAKFAVLNVASNELICDVRRIADEIKQRFAETDPGLSVDVTLENSSPEILFSEDSTSRVIYVLKNVPNGVFSMSSDVPGVVETSSNLGVLKHSDGKLEIVSMQRSLIDSERDQAASNIAGFFEKHGFTVKTGDVFPGWLPDRESNLLRRCCKLYNLLFDEDPKVTAIHAGLECGILGRKKAGMEMIALGPNIRFPHSPKEKVNIKSVGKFWKIIRELLKQTNCS